MTRRYIIKVFALGLALLSASKLVVAAPPAVNGRIEQIGPFRVLRVWGTPEEMGFAHGYLVGQGFIDYHRERLATLSPTDRAAYPALRDALVKLIEIPRTVRAEIGAIFSGMEAALGDLSALDGIPHPLALGDLLLHNAGDTVRAFACSGFTVWGARAGEAGVITTRNFDFAIPGPKSLAAQMILIRQPRGRRQVATITWPGYIGVFTGVNEEGVCAFLHDGTGPRISRPERPFTPLAIVLAEMLETAGPAQAHAAAEGALKTIVPYPFSYMVRIVTTPSDGDDRPERVFRVDASGLSESPSGAMSCITTNHYLNDDLTASANAGPGSALRYARLQRFTGSTVTSGRAWKALAAVAHEGNNPTLHSLIVYPVQRRLELAFATIDAGRTADATGAMDDGRVTVAPKHTPTPITFDELFKRDP
jgi:hypothetical protein